MPNTRLFIGYSSALYFWLRGSRGLWPAEPCRITSIARCAYNAKDAQGYDADRMALLLTSRCETGSFCQKMLAVYVL